MSALGDDKLAGGIDLGHTIIVAHRDLGKGAKHIELCHRVGTRLHLGDHTGYFAAQLREQLVFKLLYPVVCGKERVFKLFKLLRKVSFV